MNPVEWLKAINEFRGRKFLIVCLIWYLVFIGKVGEYWGGVSTLVYFFLDLLEKYITHKSEEETTIKQEEVNENHAD